MVTKVGRLCLCEKMKELTDIRASRKIQKIMNKETEYPSKRLLYLFLFMVQ